MDTPLVRHETIREILADHEIRSQPELMLKLEARGLTVTQSSVSRDLRALRVAKIDGRYVLPEALAGQVSRHAEQAVNGRRPAVTNRAQYAGQDGSSAVETLRGLVLDAKPAGPHMLVVNTPVGAAQIVGVTLDAAGWHEIVGTVAGDDTVFIATPSQRAQTRLRRRLDVLMAARR